MRASKFSALALATFSVNLMVPLSVFGTGVCSVSALDTVAGLGTQATLIGCEASKQIEITIQGPSGTKYTQTVATGSDGNATTLIPSKTTVTSGTYTISAGATVSTFTVIADRADDTHSVISASPKSVAAGKSETVTVSTVLRDRYDNPVANRSIALISNRASDEISPQMNQTDEDGLFLWKVRPTESGVMSLLLYDMVSGKQMNMRTSVTVGSTPLAASLTGFERGGDLVASTTDTGTVDRFTIELPQGVTEVKANELFSITIRAMQGNNLVRSYIGSLSITTTDPDAEVPKMGEDPKNPTQGRIDILNFHQGKKEVPLSTMFRTAGEQKITVYDKLDRSIRGEITLNVIRSGGAKESIVILEPKDGARIRGAESILVQGKAPTHINVRARAGKETGTGESDGEGTFRVKLALNPEYNEHEIFVESENGSYESEPVHIFVDNDAPKIDDVSVKPSEVKAEMPGIILLRSEPELASVVATLDGKDIALTATGDNMYVASVTAPQKDGVYDIRIVAKDSVGNEASAFVKWTVKPKTVSIVDGVSAEAQPGQVLLKWKAVQGMPIAQYKVYVSTEDDPTNYLYSIGTEKPVTSAIIKDLPLGKKYLFSLTAMNEENVESSQKSTAVAASPLGFAIRVKPGKDSVLLEWDAMRDLPLESYTLEFGTEPGAYSEKRTVNGQATSIMIRDLIPGITYEFKLTPITITGKVMSELAATERAMIDGSGFTVGAADPAPDDMFKKLHSGADLKPKLKEIPMTTTSGISTVIGGMVLLGSVILGMSWLRLRRERKMVQEFLRSMQQS